MRPSYECHVIVLLSELKCGRLGAVIVQDTRGRRKRIDRWSLGVVSPGRTIIGTGAHCANIPTCPLDTGPRAIQQCALVLEKRRAELTPFILQ
jgi:hypothetical protein